jgi:hypothetical protein
MTFYASSEKDYWETPPDLFRRIEDICGRSFLWDAASTLENKKTPARLIDGLVDEWPDMTYCNPPYGRGVYGKWIEKALGCKGRAAILIKSNTDGIAFQSLLRAPNTQFWFVPKRVKFQLDGKPVKNGATFPSCVVFINFRNELQKGSTIITEG